MNYNFIAYNISHDIYFIITGALLFGISVDMFLVPGRIVLGGFTGIATLLHILFDFNTGLIIFILNVPFAIVNVKFYGFHFIFKAILGILVTSAACELLLFLPGATDPVFCAVAGGIFMGTACALLFTRGYTTGGTDLIAWLLRVKFNRISMGTLIFISDSAVILLASFFTGSFESLMLSVLSITVCSLSLDLVLRFADSKKRVRHIP